MSDRDSARRRILEAFGVTEEDLAAVEAASGWDAARAAAELESAEFVRRLQAHAAETSERLGRRFGGEVRFDLDDVVWAVLYEDADRRPLIFAGEGAEEAARHQSAASAIAWNHTLFVEAKALDEALRARDRARHLAAHLFGMVDRQTWRDSGGDDGQGHYEGDYWAAQLAEEIRSWGEPTERSETVSVCAKCYRPLERVTDPEHPNLTRFVCAEHGETGFFYSAGSAYRVEILRDGEWKDVADSEQLLLTRESQSEPKLTFPDGSEMKPPWRVWFGSELVAARLGDG